MQNLSQPVRAQWEARGQFNSQVQELNVLSMKKEITSKEFSSLRTVKDTAEGSHQAISAGVCRHLLHCQAEPQFSKKALFLERM